MSAPTIELAGMAVRAPVTVLTNAMILGECAAFASVLRSRTGARTRLWSLFFLFMGIGALAGIPKHGIPNGVLEEVHRGAMIVSNLGVALATTVLVLLGVGATVRRPPLRSLLAGAALLQLALFSAVTVRHPAFPLVALNLAVALVPVAPAAVRALARPTPATRWVLAGLGTAALSAAIYLREIRMDAWVDHVDTSHGLVALALLFLYRGAIADEGDSWTT